jgi:hypothetical protein
MVPGEVGDEAIEQKETAQRRWDASRRAHVPGETPHPKKGRTVEASPSKPHAAGPRAGRPIADSPGVEGVAAKRPRAKGPPLVPRSQTVAPPRPNVPASRRTSGRRPTGRGR